MSDKNKQSAAVERVTVSSAYVPSTPDDEVTLRTLMLSFLENETVPPDIKDRLSRCIYQDAAHKIALVLPTTGDAHDFLSSFTANLLDLYQTICDKPDVSRDSVRVCGYVLGLFQTALDLCHVRMGGCPYAIEQSDQPRFGGPSTRPSIN